MRTSPESHTSDRFRLKLSVMVFGMKSRCDGLFISEL